MDKIPITNIGFEKLEEELKTLKSVERPTVIKSIAEAMGRKYAKFALGLLVVVYVFNFNIT